MIKRAALVVIALICHFVLSAQVNLNCPAGSSITFVFSGPIGSCVTTAPTKGFLRFAFGSNCASADNDPVLIQNQCGCCPIFTNDCFRYTNTDFSATSDAFVIGGITYHVTITAVRKNCAPGSSVAFLYSGPTGVCVTTAPNRGFLRFAFGSNCASATNDPVLIQNQCGCCPIFNNDCFRYTNTNTAIAADLIVIGGVTYVIHIGGTLPVTFTGLNAYQDRNNVLVKWTTLDESNMDRYEVERSADGLQFVAVGSVASRNCKNTCTYEWTDLTPVKGANFYRVKMIGIPGEITYSKIIKVSIGEGPADIVVAPNPIKGNSMMLQLYNLPKGKYEISLINGIGQEILRKSIEHKGGSATQLIEVPQSVIGGIYQLRVVGATVRIVKTVVK